MSGVLLILACIAFVLAVIPALMFARNWRLYTLPACSFTRGSVSVLIPARNEEASIGDAVEAALGSQNVDLEVIVLDDHSTDRTAAIVQEISARDSRVRLFSAPPLPADWCGKQHACYQLSKLASHDVFVFIDADVRLAPAGLCAATEFMNSSGSDLVSGIPLQQTGTLLEKLMIPLIHFVLLGFLPINRMRASALPAYGAGCGQLFLARRSAYEKAGGHAAIRESLHDGITLPRAFRRAGLRTDLFDATDVAVCRMYRSAGQVWRGLEKNATEGLASPAAIAPWSFILLGGQVMPIVLLVLIALHGPLSHRLLLAFILSLFATAVGLAIRSFAAIRFRQSWLGALLHAPGILVLVCIQWSALARKLAGRPARWRGRAYTTAPRTEAATSAV